MLVRTAVGLTALAVVLSISWLGGVPFLLLVAAAALVGGYEFYWMLRQGGIPSQPWLGLAWLLLLTVAGARPEWVGLTTVLTFGLIALLVYALFVPEKPVQRLLATAFPALYLGVMMAEAIALRRLPDGFWWLLLSFAIAWSSDTFAYFVGVTMGRHKIWPRLSPKKTWEGTVAGWIGAAVAAPVVLWFSPLDVALWWGAVAGFLGGILGFFGDLSISMIKRQVGVKDSGHFFPGHGGMLDRLDSMLFVIPFVYQLALLLTRA